MARFVPLDRCLIETDSPYLAPMPLPRQDQPPGLVPHVAAKLAELKGLPRGRGGAAPRAPISSACSACRRSDRTWRRS